MHVWLHWHTIGTTVQCIPMQDVVLPQYLLSHAYVYSVSWATYTTYKYNAQQQLLLLVTLTLYAYVCVYVWLPYHCGIVCDFIYGIH